jgi:hypothetical protein
MRHRAVSRSTPRPDGIASHYTVRNRPYVLSAVQLTPSMRILFVMRNHGYLRNYASTLRLLASRGHEVIVGSRGPERHMRVDTVGYLAELSRTYSNVTAADLPKRADRWKTFATAVRAVRNALRYRHPELRRARALADRAEAHLARQAPRLAARGLPRTWALASALSRLVSVVEAAIPTDPRIDATVSSMAPDVIVVTPLVDFISYQVDYVKTAKRLGIPVSMAVASWDNLTNKGTIAVQPDQVIVWNDIQKHEAVHLHGVPAERVCVTGAQLFDDWFDRAPGDSRAAFCARVGLNSDRPFLLYLCSSLFVARDEVTFVRAWLERLRRSVRPSLRECGVLIRPHPGHAWPWSEVDLSQFENAAIWPRGGDMPLFEGSKTDYFDSLFHSAAVVAINTTGIIEAGIVGRASFTLLAPDFAATQGGTLHFSYLTSPGFLRTAATFDEHHAQLDEELRHPSTREQLAPFIKAFVRPFGLDSPSTPRVAAAIEQLTRARPAPVRDGLSARLLRPVLDRLLVDAGTPSRS